ncbi:MAG: FtsX-like permease family protein [Bacteroidota bacterium]
MNFEYFFAQRIVWKQQRAISRLVVKLAIISITIAVITIVVSLSVVQGFESAIQEKVIGFASHIHLGHYLSNYDEEEKPLYKADPDIMSLDSLPLIKSIEPYVSYAGLSRSESASLGVECKGLTATYDWSFFEESLVAGELPDYSGEKQSLDILISATQSRMLDVEVGERIRIYFPRDSVIKPRRVTIGGIFDSGMEEFDQLFMICDLKMLQKVRNWEPEEVSGFEVRMEQTQEECGLVWDGSRFPFVHYFCDDPIVSTTRRINELTPYAYGATSIKALYPEIFDWLGLQHQNVWVIMLLMAVVAIINMTSVVLILILERTQTIGVLMAMGMAANRIQRVFVVNAFLLIGTGVLIGNLVAFGLLAAQYKFNFLSLSQDSYFINTVPVAWVWGRFLLANIGIILVCTLFMVIPSWMITRISPVKAIRFD